MSLETWCAAPYTDPPGRTEQTSSLTAATHPENSVVYLFWSHWKNQPNAATSNANAMVLTSNSAA
jgi:hypothetical protein